MKTQEIVNKSCTDHEENKKNDVIRQPKQTRSMETKEKILKTALRLFYENGFYKTTTNEIAKQAAVPIGSLYSYFKNKDMILLEILDDYNQAFMDRFDKLNIGENIDRSQNDKKSWIKKTIETLIEIHEETKEFNLELQALYHSMPEVSEIHNIHDLKIKERIIKEFEYFKDELKTNDIEVAAIITNDIISSVVDRIVFTNNPVGRDRIINQGTEAIYKYLFC